MLSEVPVYVVIGHTMEEKDSLVVYTGFSLKKAQEYLKMGDNMTYYTQLETWVSGERTK